VASAASAAFVIAMAAMPAGLSGCRPKNEFKQPPPAAVTVAQPLRREVVDYFQTTGETRAVKRVELRAQVSGYLKEINFKDGELVEKDRLLFVIDPHRYQAAVNSAKANLLKAEAALKLAEAQLSRTRALVERKAATKEQLDEAEAQRASASADVAASKSAISRAELDLGFTEIRAPFAGRMGRHQIDIGNLVEVGSTLLATIETVDPIYAYFNLSEADLLRFMNAPGGLAKTGENAPEIELALGQTNDFKFKGRLDFREFGVDPSTGTTVRRAVFPNADERLVPGLFVRIRAAVGPPQPHLLVEERAISSDQRGDFLLVVNDKNVVEYRPVKLGLSDHGLRVVEEGIKADDWVVINGLQRARPSATVKPEKAQMVAPPTGEPTAFRILPAESSVAGRTNGAAGNRTK
jgi:RND family efflux transporter MFP subunit